MIKILPALLIVAALSACGSSDPATVASAPSAAPSTSAMAMPSDAPVAPAACAKAPATTAPVATDTTSLTTKPVITIPKTAAPCDLQTSDIVTGSGAAAKAGDALTVKYVGVLYADGKEFDSSWSRGSSETFPFTLGAGGVIAGWDTGVVGMKVGGRRELTIPSALAYGSQGQGPIPAGATLVFVVDLVKIGA